MIGSSSPVETVSGLDHLKYDAQSNFLPYLLLINAPQLAGLFISVFAELNNPVIYVFCCD